MVGLMLITQCVAPKISQSAEVQIITVESQKYRGGLKGTPSGIKYKMLFVAPANQNEFNTIGFWIQDVYTPAKAYRNKLGNNRSQYQKGDTLVVSASLILNKEGSYVPANENETLTRPKGFTEKVLLCYTINNRKKFVGTNEIFELEEELRP